DELEFELTAGLNDLFGAYRIAFAGELNEDFVVVGATALLNGGLGEAERVDAALDRFDRLRHRRFANLRDGIGAQRQRVAVLFAGGGREIPHVLELLADEIAEVGRLIGGDIADENVRVVGTAGFIVANIFCAQLRREAIDGLIGFLRDGFLSLNLQDQVSAALKIEAELDLMREIVFDLGERRRKHRQADQAVNAADDNQNDENSFPLQIWIH